MEQDDEEEDKDDPEWDAMVEQAASRGSKVGFSKRENRRSTETFRRQARLISFSLQKRPSTAPVASIASTRSRRDVKAKDYAEIEIEDDGKTF